MSFGKSQPHTQMLCVQRCIFAFSCFCGYMHPLLEYASCVQSRHLTKDTERLERVQRRFITNASGQGSNNWNRSMLTNMLKIKDDKMEKDMQNKKPSCRCTNV